MVFLKLRDHWQTSIANRSSKKFTKLFYGPFKVSECWLISSNFQWRRVYTATFHVSFLRQALQLIECNKDVSWIPDSILDHCWSNKIIQLLVEWQSRVLVEATWEFSDELMIRFPDFKHVYE